MNWSIYLYINVEREGVCVGRPRILVVSYIPWTRCDNKTAFKSKDRLVWASRKFPAVSCNQTAKLVFCCDQKQSFVEYQRNPRPSILFIDGDTWIGYKHYPLIALPRTFVIRIDI